MNHLERRKGVYYFRVRIPADLQRYFGRKEIRTSLKVRSLTAARKLIRIAIGRFEELIFQIRYGMLTDSQITQLAQQYLRETLLETDQWRLASFKYETDPLGSVRGIALFLDEDGNVNADKAYRAAYQQEVREIRMGLHGLPSPRLDRIVEEFCQAKGLALDSKSLEYAKLRRELARVELEALQINFQRDIGDYSDPYYLTGDPAPIDQQPNTHPPSLSTIQLSTPPLHQRLLSVAAEKYLTDAKINQTASANSLDEYQGMLDRIVWILEDRPIGDVTRDEVRNFRGVLPRLPAHLAKKPEYKGKTLSQVLEMDIDHTIGDVQINKYVRLLRAVFTWAMNEGWITDNPTNVIKLAPRKRREDEERTPYSREDLQRIVDGLALVRDQLLDRPERLWVPIIGMFTGARANEICQLQVADISGDGDVWHFVIKGEPRKNAGKEGKRVKTQASNRLVPLHPTLVELGLLDYWKARKASGATQLWEHLKPTKRGARRSFSNWWNGQTRVTGFNRTHVTQDPDKVFHSFRHNVGNTLKQALVEEKVVDEILGHKHGNLALDRYGKPYALQIKLEALLKLDYGINLEPIRDLCRQLR